MIDLRIIDELTLKLGESLPPGLAQAKEEAETRFHAVLMAAFERMNLVTREEYDAQCAVLARSIQHSTAVSRSNFLHRSPILSC